MAGRIPMPPAFDSTPSEIYNKLEAEEWNRRIEKEAEEIVHVVTILDLLEAKTKLEEDGKMTTGVAACFRHALEMLRKDKHVFYKVRLLIQADGNFLSFCHQRYDETHILWYDQYEKTVQEDRLKH